MTAVKAFVARNDIRGAIFDMDGTLTDSMGYWRNIYAELERLLAITLPPDFLMSVNHIPMRARLDRIVEQFDLDVDKAAVYAEWLDFATGCYRSALKIKPYMADVLAELFEQGVKCGVATASDTACARAFIASNRLDGYFCSVTGLDEVTHPKSFPDIYLAAAKKLGEDPRRCLVFEDALVAVRAAKRGGFMVCGVFDTSSATDGAQIRSLAHITLGFDE